MFGLKPIDMRSRWGLTLPKARRAYIQPLTLTLGQMEVAALLIGVPLPDLLDNCLGYRWRDGVREML